MSIQATPSCTPVFNEAHGDLYLSVHQGTDQDVQESMMLTPYNLTPAERACNLVKQGAPDRAMKFACEKHDLFNNPELAKILYQELTYYKYPELAQEIANQMPELDLPRPEYKPEPEHGLDFSDTGYDYPSPSSRLS